MTTHRGFPRIAGVTALAVLLLGVVLAPGAPDAAAQAPGDLPWMDTSLSPEQRSELLIDAMTLDQKIQQIAMEEGLNDELVDDGCELQTVGRHLEGIPELGIPTMRWTNGPVGVKGGDCLNDPPSTAMPAPVGVGATFDQAAAERWGQVVGAETRAFAHHGILAPGLNLVRHPYGGRGYQWFSEDPFLAGVMGIGTTQGIQQNDVHATPKHLIGNEQETERQTSASNIPSRAMQELYLLPFEMTVREAEPAAVMCSYPDVAGDWACQQRALLSESLRERWGFDGYVTGDRGAMHSTVGSIEAGVDLEFGDPVHYTPQRIQMALDSGAITEEQIDQMLRPRFVKMFEFGYFDEPRDDFTFDELDTEAHRQAAREIAEQGMVLMRNDGGVLPLTGDEDTVALIGPDHFTDQPKRAPSFGLDNFIVGTAQVDAEDGLNNAIDALGADTEVVRVDGSDIDEAVDAAADADAVVLALGDITFDPIDKTSLGLPDVDGVDQEALIDALAGVNPNTVLVLKTQGMVLMPWADEFPAIVQAWYPGQEDGDAMANVLYGVVNPSGKLPVTFGNSDREAAFSTDAQFPGVRRDTGKPGGPGGGGDGSDQLQFDYLEDLEMGYRWYEANGVEPRFPFGFGLSYTTFAYSDLVVTPTTGATGERALKVDFTLTNTGDRAGAEAAQVYVTLPAQAGEPGRRLVAVEKVALDAGATRDVSITIDAAASNHPFDHWVPALPDDPQEWEQGEWRRAAGTHTVHVGGDSWTAAMEQAVAVDFPPPPEPPPAETGDIPVEAEIPDTGQPPPGSLTLTVAEFGDGIDLGTPRTVVDRLRFDGELPTVLVTDTRNDSQAAGGGWTVTGRASDFSADTTTFSAAHLGWLPGADAGGRAGVTPGPRIDGLLRGGPGLADPQTLVSATGAGRRGAALAGAHLLLEVPLSTPPGDYRSTISLSLFPED